MLWDLYYSYQNCCTPLFHMMDFLPDNGQDFDDKIYNEAPSYILQPEACMTPFITEEILENALSDHQRARNPVRFYGLSRNPGQRQSVQRKRNC